MHCCKNRAGCRCLGEWLKGSLTAVALLAGLLWCRPLHAQAISGSAFAGETAALRRLAGACAAEATACDGSKLPERQEVDSPGQARFVVRWTWLQDALQAAGKASPSDRARAMCQVEAHLLSLEQLASTAPAPGEPAEFAKARTAARAALAREEFRTTVQGPGWFDRQLAKLQDAILHLFSGVSRLGERAPWLAPLIEWTCFAFLAAGLLWLARRNLQRQALRLSLSEGEPLPGGSGQRAADWARLAEERAADQQWREAVHCLYWAAISLLESRKAWKPNATLTPREYLRLLRPGSEAQGALRSLTVAFERIWYGSTGAEQDQYLAALGSFRVLEAARPERIRQDHQSRPATTLAASGDV